MATFTLDVSDAQIPRIAASLGWRSIAEDGPRGAFIKAQVKAFLIGRVGVLEGQSAAEAARLAAHAKAATEIGIN